MGERGDAGVEMGPGEEDVGRLLGEAVGDRGRRRGRLGRVGGLEEEVEAGWEDVGAGSAGAGGGPDGSPERRRRGLVTGESCGRLSSLGAWRPVLASLLCHAIKTEDSISCESASCSSEAQERN